MFRQKIGWIRSKNVIHTPGPGCPSFMIVTENLHIISAAGTGIPHRSLKFYWNFQIHIKCVSAGQAWSCGRAGVGMDVRVTGRKIQCWLCKCSQLNSKAEFSYLSRFLMMSNKRDCHLIIYITIFHNEDRFFKFQKVETINSHLLKINILSRGQICVILSSIIR